jgi:hypothetical protein
MTRPSWPDRHRHRRGHPRHHRTTCHARAGLVPRQFLPPQSAPARLPQGRRRARACASASCAWRARGWAKAASSTACPANRPSRPRTTCASTAWPPSPTTRAWKATNARACRTPSAATRPTWWWPPWPSAWASTSPTSATSSTATCRARSRATTKRSAAPAATAWPATACSSTHGPT